MFYSIKVNISVVQRAKLSLYSAVTQQTCVKASWKCITETVTGRINVLLLLVSTKLQAWKREPNIINNKASKMSKMSGTLSLSSLYMCMVSSPVLLFLLPSRRTSVVAVPPSSVFKDKSFTQSLIIWLTHALSKTFIRPLRLCVWFLAVASNSSAWGNGEVTVPRRPVTSHYVCPKPFILFVVCFLGDFTKQTSSSSSSLCFL